MKVAKNKSYSFCYKNKESVTVYVDRYWLELLWWSCCSVYKCPVVICTPKTHIVFVVCQLYLKNHNTFYALNLKGILNY